MSSTSGTRGTPPLDRQDRISPLSGAVDVLLRFGALMLRSGNTAARTREWIELMVAELEQLAKTVEPGQTPRDIAARLAEIETTPPRYSSVQIAAAVGLASGGFAFLNGAAVVEMIASAIGGGIGQWSRSWMARRGLNHVPLWRPESTCWHRRWRATPALNLRTIRPALSPRYFF